MRRSRVQKHSPKREKMQKKPLSKRAQKKLEVEKTREKYRVPHHSQFRRFINHEIESICERSSSRYGVYNSLVRILKERVLNIWGGIGLPETISSMIFGYMFKQKDDWEYETEPPTEANSWSHMGFTTHIIPALYNDYSNYETTVTVRTRFSITFGVTDVDFDLDFYKMWVVLITIPVMTQFDKLSDLEEKFALETKTTALFKQYQFTVSPTNELFHTIYSILSTPNGGFFGHVEWNLTVSDLKKQLVYALINLMSEVMILSSSHFNYNIWKYIIPDPRQGDFYLQKPLDGEPESFLMQPDVFAGNYWHNVPDDVLEDEPLFEQVIPFWVELKSGEWMKTSLLITVYRYFFNGVSWYYLSMISKMGSIDEDGNTAPFEVTDRFYKRPITHAYNGETLLYNTMIGFHKSYQREIDISATERWCKQFVFHPAFIQYSFFSLTITREQFTGELVEPEIPSHFSFPEEGDEFDYDDQHYVWDGEPIIEVREPFANQYPLGTSCDQFTIKANQATITLVERFITVCQKEKMLPVDSWEIIFLFRLMGNFSS